MTLIWLRDWFQRLVLQVTFDRLERFFFSQSLVSPYFLTGRILSARALRDHFIWTLRSDSLRSLFEWLIFILTIRNNTTLQNRSSPWLNKMICRSFLLTILLLPISCRNNGLRPLFEGAFIFRLVFVRNYLFFLPVSCRPSLFWWAGSKSFEWRWFFRNNCGVFIIKSCLSRTWYGGHVQIHLVIKIASSKLTSRQ